LLWPGVFIMICSSLTELAVQYKVLWSGIKAGVRDLVDTIRRRPLQNSSMDDPVAPGDQVPLWVTSIWLFFVLMIGMGFWTYSFDRTKLRLIEDTVRSAGWKHHTWSHPGVSVLVRWCARSRHRRNQPRGSHWQMFSSSIRGDHEGSRCGCQECANHQSRGRFVSRSSGVAFGRYGIGSQNWTSDERDSKGTVLGSIVGNSVYSRSNDWLISHLLKGVSLYHGSFNREMSIRHARRHGLEGCCDGHD
jgi:hypothetical protein